MDFLKRPVSTQVGVDYQDHDPTAARALRRTIGPFHQIMEAGDTLVWHSHYGNGVLAIMVGADVRLER